MREALTFGDTEYAEKFHVTSAVSRRRTSDATSTRSSSTYVHPQKWKCARCRCINKMKWCWCLLLFTRALNSNPPNCVVCDARRSRCRTCARCTHTHTHCTPLFFPISIYFFCSWFALCSAFVILQRRWLVCCRLPFNGVRFLINNTISRHHLLLWFSNVL